MTRAPLSILILGALGAATATIPTAHADNGIVLESYTNARPPDAARLVAPLLEELALRKYQSGDTVGHRYDAAARPAIANGLPADFSAQVDRGYKAWIAGQFGETVKILAPLVEAAHANTGAFADPRAPTSDLQKALIALALAQQRNGDPGAAKSTLAELIRSSTSADVPRSSYGPEAADLFKKVKAEVAAAGVGKLAIKVSDPTAQIFVNEHEMAAGSVTLDLPPGEYRVFAKLGRRLSRSHRMVVHANDTASLAIEAGLDIATRTAPFVGFEIATSQERVTREGSYAVAFARLVNADSVIVVGIDQVKGKTAVVASLVSLQTGQDIRSGDIPIDPDPGTEKLRALAQFVSGGDPVEGIDVLFPARGQTASAPVPAPTGDGPTKPAPTTAAATPAAAATDAGDGEPVAVDHGSHGFDGWRWVAGGTAVAVLGAGVALYALDGSCATTLSGGRPCNDLRSTKTASEVTLGAGVAVSALAIYLFVHHAHAHAEHEPPAKTVFVAPTPGGVFAGLSTTF